MKISKGKRPFVIAGPCSAETEEQLVNTAKAIAKNKRTDLLRAGIWKPRTRPNSFEGVGSIGLKWMQIAKQETGLPTATEVANAKHTVETLNAGIDLIWIGARTATNPFAVQEIADVLKGVDIPVFVKNPVTPDIELWLGAIERIAGAGITQIGAIHRGFATYNKSLYRNIPAWAIPIELRRRMPNIPIICDPSHISGKRQRLYEIAQKALDLNFDGLMIETHINPDNAWSDAQQQVTPDGLKTLLNKIKLRIPTSENPEFIQVLEELRSQIDQIDQNLLDFIKQRMEIAEKIGEYKNNNNITILQSERWNNMIEKAIEEGKKKGLSSEFINRMFKAIHIESINHQLNIMNRID